MSTLESNPFRFLRSLGRSREIATVLLNHGFGDVVDRLGLRRYLQRGRRLLFWKKHKPPRPTLTRAQRIRLALESLGPTFIKFGQVISTRPDLVPPDVIQELCKLQEQVPPFPSDVALQKLEGEFGRPVDQLFAAFDPVPLAAGSLAQVHCGVLHDGTKVAVKLRRPSVVRDVERDLSLMAELAILVDRHIPEAQIFDPIGLVSHFARTIRRELSFAREARTMDEFARLFRNDATLVVPKVYWELTSDAVITMQFIEGYRLDRLDELAAAGICRKQVAANGARIFMKMAFELGLFHGDPHPGNLRIMPDGSICVLDYGMVGVLEDEKRDQLVDLFQAVTRQDVRRVVEVIQRLGRPFRPVDAPLLRADARDFIENYYGVPLERLSVGNMLSDFVSILASHGIRCPSDLMLLIRAIITLEGVGRDLDPEFNLASHLAPFVEYCVKERYNPQRIKQRLVAESRTFLQIAHDVPLHVARTVEKLSRDELKVQIEHRHLDRLITELDRSSNRIVVALVMSAMIVASSLIIRQGAELLWFSIPLFVFSSLLGAWLIYGVFRSGRL